MDELFEQTVTVGPSVCDASGRLSFPDAFALCMDIAAAHAQALGCGLYDLAPRDLFWVTVKTQLRFFERPRMMERVTLRTWPEAPGKLRGNRSYEIAGTGGVAVAGKTEWAVMELRSMRPALLADVYPPELRFQRPSAAPGPFARSGDSFDDAEALSRYIVRSPDIDVGGHMNNAAYVRAVFGFIPNRELEELGGCRIDAVFRTPCFEGETLTLRRKKTETGSDLCFVKSDGAAALLLRIELN